MGLKAGTQDNFAASMSEAMEHAFELVWEERMGTKLPAEFLEDRRMLFIAVAQGVIRHLRDNAGKHLRDDAGDVDGMTVYGPLITCAGTTTTGDHSHSVAVTQTDSSDNKIVSQGVVTIATTGALY